MGSIDVLLPTQLTGVLMIFTSQVKSIAHKQKRPLVFTPMVLHIETKPIAVYERLTLDEVLI